MHFGLATSRTYQLLLYVPHSEVWRLLQGRRLLEGGVYFNVDTQRCGTY